MTEYGRYDEIATFTVAIDFHKLITGCLTSSGMILAIYADCVGSDGRFRDRRVFDWLAQCTVRNWFT